MANLKSSDGATQGTTGVSLGEQMDKLAGHVEWLHSMAHHFGGGAREQIHVVLNQMKDILRPMLTKPAEGIKAAIAEESADESHPLPDPDNQPFTPGLKNAKGEVIVTASGKSEEDLEAERALQV